MIGDMLQGLIELTTMTTMMISMMKTLTMISTTTSRKRKRLPLRRKARQIKIDR